MDEDVEDTLVAEVLYSDDDSDEEPLIVKQEKKVKNESLNLELENTETRDSDDTFQCEFCDDLIPSSDLFNYKLHLINKHKQNEVRCKLCDEEFLTKGALKNHKCVIFECPKCLDRFDTKQELNKHVRTHPKSTKMICKFCNKPGNYSRSSLIIHLRVSILK